MTDLRLALSRGRGEERIFGELDDEFHSEVKHLQLLVTLVNLVTLFIPRYHTSRQVIITSTDNVSVSVTYVRICLYSEAIDL